MVERPIHHDFCKQSQHNCLVVIGDRFTLLMHSRQGAVKISGHSDSVTNLSPNDP